MGKAEQYRQYAAECTRLAQQSQDKSEKDTLVRMAVVWRRLADRAERPASKRDPDVQLK